MEGGGIQHFQTELKFLALYDQQVWLIGMQTQTYETVYWYCYKRIYLFTIVAWNYRKKTGFPVCKKENFAGLQAHRKREKSARASSTSHHTLEDVSINNEYEYENDFKPYSYSKSFSQLSMLAMTPSSSL